MAKLLTVMKCYYCQVMTLFYKNVNNTKHVNKSKIKFQNSFFVNSFLQLCDSLESLLTCTQGSWQKKKAGLEPRADLGRSAASLVSAGAGE